MMEDLRNFCSKVDVDTIRAKIPPIPQIKLPKSVSKLKSRKIFHISREDFSSISRRTSSKRTATAKSENTTIPLEASSPIYPSEFINRTPTRISTISSLKNRQNSDSGDASIVDKEFKMWRPRSNVDNNNENSYRNAGGIDDYYPSPLTRLEQRLSRQISPIKAGGASNVSRAYSEQNVRMSIGEKLQKGYKDLSGFKIKHIFARKTVVHADKIEVNSYIPSFNEDRKREESIRRKIDRDIADNYRFQFKVSKQKSDESYIDIDSPFSSPENFGPLKKQKHLSELSGDESGMESSPPKRTPGIAATRFSRVRRIPLNMSLDESYDDGNNTKSDIQQNNRKPLNLSQEEVNDIDDDDDMEIELETSPQKKPNSSSSQSPRKKSSKGTTAIASSKNRNAVADRRQQDDVNMEFNPYIQSARVCVATASSANITQENVPDDNDDDIEFYEVEELEPKKPKRNTESVKNKKANMFYRSRENIRKSIKGMTSSAAFTKERQAAINRTQEDELDFSSDGGNEWNKGLKSTSPDNKRMSHQKSLKGLASRNAFTKERKEPLNKTQEDELDLSSDGGMELYDNKKFKSPENIRISRKKSVKGIALTNAFSKERQGPLNKTQEDELDLSSDGGMELNEHKNPKSPENIRNTFKKSNRGILSNNAFSKDRQGPLNNTQEDELDLSSDGGNELYYNKKSKISENIILRQKSVKGVVLTNAFSKEHQGPLNKTQEDEIDLTSDGIDDDIELDIDEDMESPKLKPNSSTLYDIKEQKLNTNPQKSKSIKERMSRFTKQKSDDNDKVASEKRRGASHASDQSLDNEDARKSDKPLDTIKQNFKRIHKSIKIPQHTKINSGSISENDDTFNENTMKLTKTQQLSKSIKRFRSSDNIDKTSEDGERIKSPIHHNFTNKIQGWTKSIKKKVDSNNIDNDDYGTSSPQRQIKPVGSLIKKLKHIRARTRPSNDDPDDDEEGGDTYKESFAARAKLQFEKGAVAASQVPQMTMKKISETKKLFKKKQEENDIRKKPNVATNTDEEDLDEGKIKTPPKNVEPLVPTRPPPPIPRPFFNNISSEEEDDADNQKFITKSIAESQLIAVPAAKTVWATKPILSDDTTDYEEDLPRVVLHQDNTNLFEPTLIIAVTRPISYTTSPIITEIPLDSTGESTPDTKPDNWIPNPDKVATFLEMTPPSQRRISLEKITNSHARNESIDYSSDDSWINDIPKGPSTAVPIIQQENENAWMIQKPKIEEQIHKTNSVDIFDMQKQQGGILSAFEDFDDELKNTPVIKIEKEIPTVYETETDDNDEFKDFDEYEIASPVKIEVQNATPVELEKKISSADGIEAEVFKNLNDELKETSAVKLEKKTPADTVIIENTNYITIEKEIDSKDKFNKNGGNHSIDIHRNIDDYQRESSEELECADDDNSSRVTKISVHCLQTLGSEKNKSNLALNLQSYSNSRESLTGYLDNKNSIDSGEEDDIEESDDDNKELIANVKYNIAPSKTPSPPPLPTKSPPLPQRKPSINISSFELDSPTLTPPPMPLTKPPVLPKRPTPNPPKIPHRNYATKPLVKTSSLRLAYNEQVHPNDVGKVNKLITRFEGEAPKRRPILISRKPYLSEESEESCEEEDLIELLPKKYAEKVKSNDRSILQKSLSIGSDEGLVINDKKPTSIDIKNNRDDKSKTKYNPGNQEKLNFLQSNNDIPDKEEKKTSYIDNLLIQKNENLEESNSDNKPTSSNILDIQEKQLNVITNYNDNQTTLNNTMLQNQDNLNSLDLNHQKSNTEIQKNLVSKDSVDNSEKKPTDIPINIIETREDKENKLTPTSYILNIQEKIAPTDSAEISNKISTSILTQDYNDDKPPITIDISKIPEIPILLDPINIPNRKHSPINNIDKNLTSGDTTNTNDNQKKSDIVLKKSLSIDCDEFQDINEEKPSHNDIKDIKCKPKLINISETQKKSNSLEWNFIDIPSHKEDSLTKNSQKQQTPISADSLTDIPNNNWNKQTSNSILPIEDNPQQFISQDSITTIQNNNKTTINNDILQIQENLNSLNLDPKQSTTPFNISESQIELISNDSVNISDQNNTSKSTDIPENYNKTTRKNVSQFQQNLISRHSQENPTLNDINDITCTEECVKISDRKSALFHIEDNNDNKSHIDITENTILINILNKELLAIENTDKKLISTDITNINDNQNKSTIVPDNNDNISTAIPKLNTPRLFENINCDIINTNKSTSAAIPIYSSCTDINLNVSQPESRYGSPETFPSNLMESAEVNSLSNRKEFELSKRSNRHLPDEDNFMSVDSDEENSYYSLSSTSSNRYVVDL